MSSSPSLTSSPRARGGRFTRRAVLGGLATFATVLWAPAGKAQQLYRRRPPLPKMGPSFRTEVSVSGDAVAGDIFISTAEKTLILALGGKRALAYRISVGRQGFGWSGSCVVGAKAEWPDWRPPAEMRARQPDLPELVPAGPYNPLGARALYLYRNGRDTIFRIHGTNDADGVGFDNTSGCFRLTNTDIVDLYERVPVGTRVEVV